MQSTARDNAGPVSNGARIFVMRRESTQPFATWIFRMHQRHVDEMLAQKPHLQFIAAQHIADDHVVGAVVAKFDPRVSPVPGNGQ